MGKRITNPKLLKQPIGKNETMLSVFNRFANKITQSHKKKIEKVGDTKQRLMEAKKTNRMVKVSKRTSKFALIDQEPTQKGLTHRGKSINELQQFNDMNFGSDVEDDQFLKAHENLNFTGFNEEQSNEKEQDPDRPKSKAEIYKQIIEKSKLHKHLRQEVYQQNFQKAVELDNDFQNLVNKLKFRTRDSNVKDKVQNDHEFDKLANELKEDERVVSNKVIEKNEKYTDKVKRKKNQQLNALMKDSSDSEDIRDWAKNANEESQEEEQEEDEIDDVNLSSDEEAGEEEGEDSQQFEEDEQPEESEGESEQSEIQASEEQEQQQQSLVKVPIKSSSKQSKKIQAFVSKKPNKK